jgi:hypothetical protein
MSGGYNKPLYILPFDHRASFQTGLFGWKGTLTPEQTDRVAESKQVVYEGLKAAVAGGVPKDRADILVDEQFGAAILADANKNGYITAAPAEKSGMDEFDFEYGADYGKHIEAMNPTFCKVLVRYNPEGDAAMSACQAARLRELGEYLQAHNRLYMFELLMPATKEQLVSFDGDQSHYDLGLRPELMVLAIRELQDAGVEPDVWKIGGAGPAVGLPGRGRRRAARRPEERRLHHPGARRERAQSGRVDAGRRGDARLHRLRRGPHDLLGIAHRLAGREAVGRGGGRRDREPLSPLGRHLRAGWRHRGHGRR